MTSKVAKPVDGDDYTWEPLPGGAVLNPTGSTGLQVEATEYNLVAVDLRTPDQREREDVAALWAEIARLRELVQLTTAPVDVALRVDELEQQVTCLRRDLATLRLTLEQMFKIHL